MLGFCKESRRVAREDQGGSPEVSTCCASWKSQRGLQELPTGGARTTDCVYEKYRPAGRLSYASACGLLMYEPLLEKQYTRLSKQTILTTGDVPYTRPWNLNVFSGKTGGTPCGASVSRTPVQVRLTPCSRVRKGCNVTLKYHRRARATSQCTHLQRTAKAAFRCLPRERQSRGEVPSQAGAPVIIARSTHCC